MTTERVLGPDEAREAEQWFELVKACLANGDDLVRDAALLLEHGRLPRALSLSVLALEEYGKAMQALVVIKARGRSAEIADYERSEAAHRFKLQAAQAWTAIVNPAEMLDGTFVERSHEIIGRAGKAKMAGFYVDRTGAGVHSPDQTSLIDARTHLQWATSLGGELRDLVSRIAGVHGLHLIWRYGTEFDTLLATLIEEHGLDETTVVGALRSLLPPPGRLPAGDAPSSAMHFLGVDLAWADSKALPNETGIVLTDSSGQVLAAGWTRGVAQTLAWIEAHVMGPNVLAFVDAPLVVNNATGQRRCETQVGQRYGRWKVSANSTNTASKNAAGIDFLVGLEQAGWRYDPGFGGAATSGRHVSECYPYTTLVGAHELGYDDERPRYKRRPRGMPAATWRPGRSAACDGLLARMGTLAQADPALDLRSHPVTAALLSEPSPLADAAYKHREDLLDAALCAWTAALWSRHGFARCQVLGDPDEAGVQATIIAPSRREQRDPKPSSVRMKVWE